METTIILSGQLFLFLAWIFTIIMAIDTEDVFMYWINMAFGIPLGMYYLWLATTSDILPNLAGIGIIAISVYYVYIGTATFLKRGN